MTEKWVPEAIAQQEEYLKRRGSCEGVRFRAHKFADFRPDRPGTIPSADMWRACIACGVTETDEDYQRKLGAQ